MYIISSQQTWSYTPKMGYYNYFIIIQAKKFLKGDWLKRVVFQPNLKYLHEVFHFHGNQHGRVLILKTWQKDFLNERECCLLEFCHGTEMSIYPSGFGCFIYCLAGENGQWVLKNPEPHSWMKLVALRANSRVCTRKLSNVDWRKSKHLNSFLCIHFSRVLLKTWRKGFPNECECCLLEFRRNVHISQVKVSWWKQLKMALLKSEIS